MIVVPRALLIVRIVSRMASRPRGSSPAVGSSRISTLGSMAMHTGDGHPALLAAGKFKGRLPERLFRQIHRISGGIGRAGRSPPRPVSYSSGRRRCPCIPSPQRADTPGTGTPAPPGSGSSRDLLGLRPDILSLTEDLAGGGLQQAVEVLDQGGFAGAGVADDAHELARAGIESTLASHARSVQRACPRCRCGSASAVSMIGSNAVLHPV